MNSRGRRFVALGAGTCLILVGTCWVNGQQYRYREVRPLRVDMPVSDGCGDSFGGENEHAYQTGNSASVQNGDGYATPAPMQSGARPMPGQRSSALVGTNVKLSDGPTVGRVEDLMINENGCVDYMIVSFNGLSGFGGQMAAIPWSAGQINFAARTITLDIERNRLHEAPIFFSRGRAWPNLYEPQWAASVHEFFGVDSDIEKRIERAYRTPESREPARGDRETRSRGERQQTKPEPTPMPEGRRELNRNGDRPVPEGRLNRQTTPERTDGTRPAPDTSRSAEPSGKKSDLEKGATPERPAPSPAKEPDRDREEEGKPQ